jgi:hypothetical protein
MLVVMVLHLARKDFIATFKIAYYESKLEVRGVKIDHIKDITLFEITKL